MFHVLKYVLLSVFLFAVLNLFRSNLDTLVEIRFSIPLIWELKMPPVSLDYLILGSFCVGMIFAAFIGAFRGVYVKKEKKAIRRERESLRSVKVLNEANEQAAVSPEDEAF